MIIQCKCYSDMLEYMFFVCRWYLSSK